MPTYPARGPRPTFPTGGGSSGERELAVEVLDAVVKSLLIEGLQIRICAQGSRPECAYRIPGPYGRAAPRLPCGAKHVPHLALLLGVRGCSALSAVSTLAASHAPLSAGHQTPARAREVRHQRGPRLPRLQVWPRRRRRGSLGQAPWRSRKLPLTTLILKACR